MTNLRVLPQPFTALGPVSRFWLDAFDPNSELHRFLPVGALDSTPFPGARLEAWGNDTARRKTLAAAFESLGLPYSSAQSQAIQDLLEPNSLVVVTGQQPGALGGPLYTFSKILSAVVFAQNLRAKWGIPVLPVLWDGGDDHDLAEVDEVAWPKGEDGISRFHCDIGGRGPRPAWMVQVDESMRQSWEQFLGTVHPPTEYRQQFIDWTAKVWTESRSWCDLFDRFWLRIFENHPLLIVRPWETPFRKMAREVMSAEVGEPTASMEAVAATTAEATQAGYKPQVHKKMGICNFLYLDGVGRRSVLFEGGQFSIEGKETSIPGGELLAECLEHPERFSPNALLRPVVQDSILPSAAVVLGPSEIAYHAQLSGLYARHSVTRSWVLPRLSVTFATAGQMERMEELGLSWTDLRRDEAELMKSLTAAGSKDQAQESLEQLQEHLSQTRDRVLELLRGGRQHLAEPTGSQLGRAEKILGQVRDLLLRDEAKRDSTRLSRLRSLKINLLPEGDLQERVYGLSLLLCRHGFDWIDPLIENARGWSPVSHFVITLGR